LKGWSGVVPDFSGGPPGPEVSKEETERNCRIVLMIRLARVGARKQPYYRVVVIEKDRARNGRSVEVVGTYNPRTNPATVDLKLERIEYWRAKGAQPSDRVAKLLQSASSGAGLPPATTTSAAGEAEASTAA
jgi:small subunit ribosomal protein S16